MKYTIEQDINYEEKIQKSTFVGHLHHISDLDSARKYIQEINKLHSQATHNCPAYIIGKNGEICFSSDDGEPSGTAGKPILNMIQRHDLTNVAIIVTRYFGGVKLGVRGLIDAYGGVAENTILKGIKVPVIDYFTYICIMPYDFYNIFSHRIQIPGVSVKSTDYSEKVEVTLSVTEFENLDLHKILTELSNNQKFEFLQI